MTLADRIKAFDTLGSQIRSITTGELDLLIQNAAAQNRWFTSENVSMAIQAIAGYLRSDILARWTAAYAISEKSPRTVGVVMAGNIPLVGFHDFLCVLISGNRLKAKLSSKDPVLLTYLAECLLKIEPRFTPFIQWADRLDKIDAVIATGSDNTSRYFDYYFRSMPKIIRKNRSSCAILSGEESTEEIMKLGLDVFSYFGLGCRNVSHLFIPPSFDFQRLTHGWAGFKNVIDHSKYVNNYDYQKSIFIVNKIPFQDTGFVLIKEDSTFVSPVSVLHFEYYADTEELQQKIATTKEKIQCTVSAGHWFPGSIDFGVAQFPDVSSYADQVDTITFLTR